MLEKILILHIPVIHKGYLDFFKRIEGETSNIYLIDEELQEELSEIKSDIASIDSKTVKELLNKIGFENILIFSKSNIEEIRGKEIVLIQNEISRNLYEKYLKGEKVEWESVFLRWDKNQVLTELPTQDIPISKEPFDAGKMEEAYKEAEKSSDWWRQIGAVLVKNRKIVARSYNQGVPNDNTPYQLGSIRDLFKAGEKQDFSPTIHAEQKLISEAAKNGIQLQGTTLYLTHFPCSVCAKLIAYSGIKNLYFSEGASNLDGKKILELVGVKIIHLHFYK
ncbi:deaminase [Patescibacteria group bacterium]|nr:deaminase [Patescibacteria group bacterium]